MVRADGGEGVGPFRKIGGEEGARKGKVQDAGAPNEGHHEPSENTWDVKGRKPQFRGSVKVGGRGGNLVHFEDHKMVCRGVVNVEVTQRECGEGRRRNDNRRGKRAGVVETTFRTVGVDDRKSSRRRVKEPVRGEEVQSHNITLSEQMGPEGNSSQK